MKFIALGPLFSTQSALGDVAEVIRAVIIIRLGYFALTSAFGPSRSSRDVRIESVPKRTSPTVAKPSRFATNMAHRREAEPPDMLGLDVDAVALPGRRLPLLKALRWNP
jgi:hypothetical protein